MGGSTAGLLAEADVGAGGKPNDGIGGWAGFSTGLGAAGVADGALNRFEGGAAAAGAAFSCRCSCCFSLIFDIAAASRSCFSHFE